MGLYLCVFDDATSDELDAVDVGAYQDFHMFRQMVADRLEPGGWGSRFPTLMLHADDDGEWTPVEAVRLESELRAITEGSAGLAAIPLPDGWQRGVASEFDLRPASLLDCFIDVNGDPLVQRLIELARVAQCAGKPISFQ